MTETLLQYLSAFGTECGEPGFITALDLDGDCMITVYDILSWLADLASPSKG